MARPDLSPEERIAFAATFYREKVMPLLSNADAGKFVVVDLNSGDYEVDDRQAEASIRLRKRRPNADAYPFLDDEPYIIHIGGSWLTFDPPL